MSDENTKEYKQVSDKRDELGEVFSRMDKDETLYYLETYKMKRLPPRHNEDMPDVANITLNDPLIFGNKGIAVLGATSKQTIIEGEGLKDTQTSRIEGFLDDVFYVIDKSLPKKKIPGLDAFINEQVCLRGRWATRVCVRIGKDGSIVFDVLPTDGKCFANDSDGERDIWDAHWYNQTKTQIEREYNKPGDKPVTVASGQGEVVDFWNDEVNIIFVDKQIARIQPNTYGKPPFVSVMCPIGSFLNSTRAIAHQGESIFWPNRDIWPEKNRVASILLTMTINALFGALQFKNPAGAQAIKPQVSPFEAHTVQPIPVNASYEQIPFSDIKRATNLLYSILETCLQRGSIAAIDYGTLTFPLSSLAITRLTASRDDIFLPRVNTIAEYYQALSREIIDQCIALGQAIEIKGAGSKNKYTIADLEGEYTIQYQFRTISAEQKLADLSTANASRGLLSEDTIRRDILKLDNPDGEKFAIQSEEAEKIDEVLFLFRRGMALLEKRDGEKPSMANMVEAYILSDRIDTILTQRQSLGQLSPIEGKAQSKTKSSEELLPLLDKVGAGGASRGGASMPPEPPEAKETANE